MKTLLLLSLIASWDGGVLPPQDGTPPPALSSAQAAQGLEAQDVNGWRAAKWGMTEAEILSAFPTATRLDKAERILDHAATVAIDFYRIDSGDYQVVFGFNKKGGLSVVRIAPSDSRESIGKGEWKHKGLFSSLEDLLTQKYGPPTRVTKEETHQTRIWNFPATIITLSYVSLPGVHSDVLMLMYAPPSTEADKL